MRIALPPSLRIATGLLLAALLSIVGYQVFLRTSSAPEALLKQADDLSWLNSWIAADPLYRRAELAFLQEHELSKALYARVSQIPAQSESSTTVPDQLAMLRHDLELPEARDSETRLRILTILGMLETDYDAAMARQTWGEVHELALKHGHYLLASRASGEQGVAAYLLGDLATAKKQVYTAWMIAKAADPGAHVRYASLYGTGMVEQHRYREALGPLNEAIRVAAKTRNMAHPTIAVYAKIEALSALGDNQQALSLVTDEMRWASRYHLAGHLFELYHSRAQVFERMGEWDNAIADMQESVRYAKQLSYWRGLVQVDGLLAEAYIHQGTLQPALAAINEAIESNKNIPDELYFVPRNLGIKAEILARLGDTKASNNLYEKSADLFDAFLSKVPTPNVERQLLNDLSIVYAGYFTSLCDQDQLAKAFAVIERARGRLEAQDLSHHEVITPHQPTSAELHLTSLNLQLLDSDDPSRRGSILNAIYSTELQLGDDPPPAAPQPAALSEFQHDLRPSELFLEYVLGDPSSHVLAVTRNTANRYTLPAKGKLEQDATRYRAELMQQGTDLPLGQQLFDELLGSIPEFKEKSDVIVVPDGKLHMLPFSALVSSGQYVLNSHVISGAPSGTVLDLLRHRAAPQGQEALPYLGVAAWTSHTAQPTLLASITRAMSGPKRSDLVALPESEHEVETIASDLPKPSTILLGGQATETSFKHLALNRYDVIHLALHGYADPEFSDRSALVFAPESPPTDDGMLQIREIRKLPLNATLVTLSACNTGVGEVGEEGVANIVNAFIEAGAQSVVSTLWDMEDRATAKLMISFYRHLSDGKGKADALRESQIELLKSGNPPYFWAGFELDGEPSATLFRNSRSTLSLRSSR
jgi:CHAT domain-containing protein